MSQLERIQKKNIEARVLLEAGWLATPAGWSHPEIGEQKFSRDVAAILEFDRRLAFNEGWGTP